MRFIDLFAGLGGFHVALSSLGHTCVFACEADIELRKVYVKNFPELGASIYGDIRECKDKIPPHDILCAGFPCQPFSKSGNQLGRKDQTRGTLFYEILEILTKHKPEYVFLENVGNFERHDQGRTWKIVRESLEELGYDVQGTEQIQSGGPGLISPHHLGFPHSRERFFIIGRLSSCGSLPEKPFPISDRKRVTDLTTILQSSEDLNEKDQKEVALSPIHIACIEHWNKFLDFLPKDIALPSFPIWADEIDAKYPFEENTPRYTSTDTLRQSINRHIQDIDITHDALIKLLPKYAQSDTETFPDWKIKFIRQNRDWFKSIRNYIPDEWINDLHKFPLSRRKLEWNFQGGERNLWHHVLQLRPSGVRVKRLTSSPALVAMTTTQIPILGPQKRFLSRTEGLRLQGFPDNHKLPLVHERAFQALGNAVHVGVVREIASRFLRNSPPSKRLVPPIIWTNIPWSDT